VYLPGLLRWFRMWWKWIAVAVDAVRADGVQGERESP
jgi:hypothetical protein